MKVLNLYAGLGGNRKLWEGVEVTSVENNKEIARVYSKYFPQDKMIVGDAHQYLLDHYKEFDIIWTSRPCIKHSRSRMWASKGGRYPAVYPDMGLYEEIIFLDNFFDGDYVVENVIPYYSLGKFLIQPTIQIGRHLIWTNIKVTALNHQEENRNHNSIGQSIYGFDLSNENVGERKDRVIRNCVNPEIGLHILNCARGIIIRSKEEEQQQLF